MLTSSMIAVVLLVAIGSAIARGIDAIEALDAAGGTPVEAALIGLEEFSKEVQESSVYPDVPFEGKADKLSFPHFVPADAKTLADFKLGQVQTLNGQPAAYTCEKIEFYYDAARKALMRKAGEESGAPYIEGVDGVEFYYAFLSEGGSLEWIRETPETGTEAVLAALNVRIRFAGLRARMPLLERVIPLVRLHPLNALKYAAPAPEGQV